MPLFEHGYDNVYDRSKVNRPQIDPRELMLHLAQQTSRSLDPIGEAIKHAEPASCVVFVIQQQASGPLQWTGSGFLVPGNYIITADHVLPKVGQGEAEVSVSFDGVTMIPVSVVRGDKDVDVGLLHCPIDLPVEPMTLATEPVAPGDIIAVIGSPEGWDNVVTVGRVSATEMTPPNPPDASWQDMTFIDAHILEGSSGSMVIDVTGKVIGLVMGVIGRRAEEAGVGQNAVVPAHRIAQAIQNIS